MYGLKQAPRAWYGRIDSYLQQLGFVKSDADPNLYYLMVKNEPLIMVLYVDDLFLTRSSRFIKHCKNNLEAEFDMKDMGFVVAQIDTTTLRPGAVTLIPDPSV